MNRPAPRRKKLFVTQLYPDSCSVFNWLHITLCVETQNRVTSNQGRYESTPISS